MATFFFGVFLCVDGPICLVSLCAGCVLSAQGAIGLASTVKVVEDERKIFCYSLVFIAVLTTADLWSFIYQHEEKSGWLLDPTFGGSVPLRGSSSPGDTGFLGFLEASDPSLPVDAMVFDHHLQPVRSAFIMHVDPDVLLKMAPKIHVLRREEVGIKLGAPAGGGEDDRECTRT